MKTDYTAKAPFIVALTNKLSMLLKKTALVTSSFIKTPFLKALCIAVVSVGVGVSSVQAYEPTSEVCAETWDYSQRLLSWESSDPFMLTDYQATLEKLPVDQRAEAERLVTEIESLQDELYSREAGLVEMGTRLDTMENRLWTIFSQVGVAPEEVDLLSQLSEPMQLKALLLWREIQQTSWSEDTALNEKLQEFESILSQLHKPQ